MHSSAPLVNFSARVSLDDKEALDALFPIYGNLQWLVQSGLQGFLAAVREHPDLVRTLTRVINREVAERVQPEPAYNLRVKIARHEYDEFNSLFPQYGASTWFIRNILREFILRAEGRGIRLATELDATVVNLIQAVQESPL